MSERRSRIAGVGSYLPPKVVTNDDLAQMLDTSDEWIRQRSGIRTRHWVEGETTTSDLAAEATREALAMAGCAATDLDMIVFATISPDHEFPGSGCFLQPKIGVTGIPALDIRQACTGFVYAISIADQYIRSGMYSRILVVGAEIHSKGLDKTDAGRDTTVLFGDGAGAVVVEANEVDSFDDPGQIYSTHLHSDGRHARELWIPAPTQSRDSARITHEMLDAGEQYPRMNGKKVFIAASKAMPESIVEACEANSITPHDVDLYLFHQANLRINQQVAKGLGVGADKVFNTIEKFGNTTAATIPIGMAEAIRAGRLERGMIVALSAFGSGFGWGSVLLRF
ncbi:3-oxoacyl-ACP synthase [bacterium]|nr:MAG: 3-oxoacyl-ACP synthase [bacterium]RKZ15143.1 MAG: 3-oxoacyl-ACP synthase [bacterium]